MDLGTLKKTPVCCFSAIRRVADIHTSIMLDSLLMCCTKQLSLCLQGWFFFFCQAGRSLCQKGKMSLIYVIYLLRSQ